MPDLGLAHASYLHDATNSVERQAPDGSVVQVYPRRADPGDATVDHLVFALKHDGVDLRVLRAVLAQATTAKTVRAALA